jgi:hypothetical protein
MIEVNVRRPGLGHSGWEFKAWPILIQNPAGADMPISTPKFVRTSALALLALVGAGWSTSADAAPYVDMTGVISGGDFQGGISGLPGGTYQALWSSKAILLSGLVSFDQLRHYHVETVDGVVLDDDYNGPDTLVFGVTPGTRAWLMTFRVPQSWQGCDQYTCAYELWSGSIQAHLVFEAGSDGLPYHFSITALPEPATWATMLVGFGLTGAVLRTRRRVAVRAEA